MQDEARSTVSAPDGGLEEVVVLASPFALATGVECLANLLEQGLGDEWLVVAGILHATVCGDA